jgi:hypothetical protein
MSVKVQAQVTGSTEEKNSQQTEQLTKIISTT